MMEIITISTKWPTLNIGLHSLVFCAKRLDLLLRKETHIFENSYSRFF